jgi:hypothetical protein
MHSRTVVLRSFTDCGLEKYEIRKRYFDRKRVVHNTYTLSAAGTYIRIYAHSTQALRLDISRG